MDKNFKFKLNGFFKFKKFKEERLKIEIADILKEMEKINDEIAMLNDNLDRVYQSQENLMEKGVYGKILRAYPGFIQGIREDIKNKTKYLEKINDKYNKRLEEMRKIMGDVKVLKKLEFKQRQEHNKKINRKNEEAIEEIINMRRGV